MMSSFSPLDYWKNLPLWKVCMCLCWVRIWQSRFSTHFCCEKVPFVFCEPEKLLAWVGFMFQSFFCTENVGAALLHFCRQCGISGPKVGRFSYLQYFSPVLCIPLLLSRQLLCSVQTAVHENIAGAPLHMLTCSSCFQKFAVSVTIFFCWTSWHTFSAKLAAFVQWMQPEVWGLRENKEICDTEKTQSQTPQPYAGMSTVAAGEGSWSNMLFQAKSERRMCAWPQEERCLSQSS